MGFNCVPAPSTGYLEHVGLLRAAGMGLSFAVPAIRSKHWVLAAALLVAGVGAFLWLGSGPAGPPPPASVLGIDEASLPGVPRSLLPSLQTARLGGRRALREWMRQNEKRCLDPLLAWIQLEYAVLARAVPFDGSPQVVADGFAGFFVPLRPVFLVYFLWRTERPFCLDGLNLFEFLI